MVDIGLASLPLIDTLIELQGALLLLESFLKLLYDSFLVLQNLTILLILQLQKVSFLLNSFELQLHEIVCLHDDTLALLIS